MLNVNLQPFVIEEWKSARGKMNETEICKMVEIISNESSESFDWFQTQEEIQKRVFTKIYEKCGFSARKSAKFLKMDRTRFTYWLKKYQIKKPDSAKNQAF